MPLAKSTVRAVCSFEAQSRKFPHPCHCHSIGYDALWLQLPGVAESFKRHAGQILAARLSDARPSTNLGSINQFGYREGLDALPHLPLIYPKHNMPRHRASVLIPHRTVLVLFPA